MADDGGGTTDVLICGSVPFGQGVVSSHPEDVAMVDDMGVRRLGVEGVELGVSVRVIVSVNVEHPGIGTVVV